MKSVGPTRQSANDAWYIGSRPHVPPRERTDQFPYENCSRPSQGGKLACRRLENKAVAALDPISEVDVEAAWSAEIERRLGESLKPQPYNYRQRREQDLSTDSSPRCRSGS